MPISLVKYRKKMQKKNNATPNRRKEEGILSFISPKYGEKFGVSFFCVKQKSTDVLYRKKAKRKMANFFIVGFPFGQPHQFSKHINPKKYLVYRPPASHSRAIRRTHSERTGFTNFLKRKIIKNKKKKTSELKELREYQEDLPLTTKK